MTASNVDFGPLLAQLEAESILGESIREQSKELDKLYRILATTVNKLHSTPQAQAQEIVVQAAPVFADIRAQIQKLLALIPSHEYWKWQDGWSFQLQRIVYAAALLHFIASEELISKEISIEILGLKPENADRLYLSTEEYLHAIVSMLNEMSRLAVNSVTLGDYAMPLRLSSFVKDVHAGFQLLNMKNDSLRKRFDGVKYDVKKIEEVVYDISLRGLLPSNPGGTEGATHSDLQNTEATRHVRARETLALLRGF